MDKYVAALNIEHLRKQALEERDSSKREILLNILAEEEATLAAIEARSRQIRKI
jgi:hypothetical protein